LSAYFGQCSLLHSVGIRAVRSGLVSGVKSVT
jgi:hypothetical protein